MGIHNVGDRVESGGLAATVIKVHDLVTIQWDVPGQPVYGTWPATAFTAIEDREFVVGQFVRVVADDFNGVVGMVIADDGDDEDDIPYMVALFDDDGSEEPFDAAELVPWIPFVGERVIEAGVEEDEIGTVLSSIDENNEVRVLWDSFPHDQSWPVSDLEPADESEEFGVGDIVEYSNPFFTGPQPATIVGIDGNSFCVRFHEGCVADGSYSKDFFSKKVA